MNINKTTILALFTIATINLAFAAAPTSQLQAEQTQKHEQKNDGYWLSRNAERFFLVTASAALGALGYWYFGGSSNEITKVDAYCTVSEAGASQLKNIPLGRKIGKEGTRIVVIDLLDAIKALPRGNRAEAFPEITKTIADLSQTTR